MKKIPALMAAAALIICVASACGTTETHVTNAPDPPQTDAGAVTQNGADALNGGNDAQETEEKINPDYLKAGGTEDDGYLFALGYAGAIDTESLNHTSDGLVTMPFFDFPLETVMCEGSEGYVVIPKYSESKCEVTALGIDDEGELSETGTVATPNGSFLLVCNISDLYPNCEITVTAQDGTADARPFISLMDGSLTGLGDGVKDISMLTYAA